MNAAVALGFGIPIGLVFTLPLLAWDRLRASADDARAVVAFPALMVAAEWAQTTFTPLGSWGAAAYTQVEDLALLQVASVFGLAGVSAVVYGVAAALDHAWHHPGEARPRWLAIAAALLLIPQGLGQLRLAMAPEERPTARVAAVGTDATFGGLPLPSPEALARIDEGLFRRSREAAAAGAQIVVWNEGATLATPETEGALVARAQRLAAEAHVDLVVAYIVPVSLDPLRYENKYAWIRPDGSLDHSYLKRVPVPGEPAIPGAEGPSRVETAAGAASGAICYDYDFPAEGRARAALGVDLVALPSSDWRGIDPIHTQMASLRAIEGGYALLRSTRMGLSAGIDGYGRIRGWMSANESDERILLVSLPTQRIPTLYPVIGDALVYLGLAYVAGLSAALLLRRRSWVVMAAT